MRGLHRSGAVLGISGGIDSSVCLALSVKAFGAERVVPLLLPDKDSDPGVGGPGARPRRPLRRHSHPGGRHAGPGRVRLLRPPRRGHRPGVPRIRPRGRLQGEDRPAVRPAGRGDAERVLPDDRHAGRRGEERPPGAGRSRPDRGGVQLQAAQPHDHALLPRGAPELRRRRDAQQERTRPGVLRQVRRRGLRPLPDRASLQDPGLPAGRATWTSPRPSRRARPPPTPTAPRPPRRSSSSVSPTRPWTCSGTRRRTGSRWRRPRTHWTCRPTRCATPSPTSPGRAGMLATCSPLPSTWSALGIRFLRRSEAIAVASTKRTHATLSSDRRQVRRAGP